MMCDTPHWLKCLHERVMSSTRGHPCRAFDCLFSLCSSPCSFPCVSPIPCSSLPTSTWTLNLFLHVVDIRAISHWHSANWGVWPLGRIHPSHILSSTKQEELVVRGIHTGAVYQVTQPPVGPITEDTFWATRHLFHDDGVVKWCVPTGVQWTEVLDQRKKIHIRTR